MKTENNRTKTINVFAFFLSMVVVVFLASLDPVALDKASFDLVLNESKEDPFKKVYPDIDSDIQFEHTKKIGFGSTEYELITIEGPKAF